MPAPMQGRFRRYRGCFFPGLEVESKPEISEEEAIRIAWVDRKAEGVKLPALTSLQHDDPDEAVRVAAREALEKITAVGAPKSTPP